MGLASALSTALTGLTAAETTIDVVGNNLANANTVGFKASRAAFATQFLQTLSLGSAPTENSGGTNPRQLGLGTVVADVTPNFNQGTVEISSNPLDMAIQGEGFFIVQGASSEVLFTRNGIFKMNAQNELVAITGQRLLGYVADDQFQIQTTGLQPITIPLGSAAVAQATRNAYVEGTLSPTGNLATSAAIIETGVLTNALYQGPDTSAVTLSSASEAPASTLAGVPLPIPPAVQYRYRATFYNSGTGAESSPSGDISGDWITDRDVAPTQPVQVTGLPTTIPSGYDQLRLYRTHGNDPSTYYLVTQFTSGTIPTTYSDSAADAALVTPLVDSGAGGAPEVANTRLAAGYLTANATYYYKTVLYNTSTGKEGLPSAAQTITLAPDEDSVTLSNLPPSPSGGTYEVRVYRTVAGDASTYYYVGSAAPGGSLTDGTSDAALLALPASQKLDQSVITPGTYQYYVTFYDIDGNESTPQTTGALNLTINQDGRIELHDLPVPQAGDHPGGGWIGRRIYRNSPATPNEWFRVGQVANVLPSLTFTDGIDNTTLKTLPKLDFTGVKITETTLVNNIRRWDGSSYLTVFQTGTFRFTGKKGGRSLATKELAITSTTTVKDLMTFMEQAIGIQKSPGPDASHPIPKSQLATGGEIDPGGVVQDGKIVLVGNNGVDNAVDITLSGLQLIPTGSTVPQTINLPFSAMADQYAVGESAVTDFVAYDSLGIPLSVRLTAVLESRDSAQTTYRWFADSPNNDPASGVNIAVGTGLMYFDGEGNFVSATDATVSIERRHVPSVSPASFELDFSRISGLATAPSNLAVTRQDGSAAGVLTSFITGEDGLIRGVFSNGVTRDLAQIILARFANPAGLEQRGQNLFAPGVNSGLPVQGRPGEQGIGTIVAGAVELSNTDIGGNLIDLILASTMYRGNTRVITTVQQMLDELLALRR